MAIPPRPTVTPRRACRSSATRCCATSIKTPSIGTRTSMNREKSRACSRPDSRTCWSTALPVSRLAWRQTFRPITSARSSTHASAFWKIRRQICSTSWSTFRAPISRRAVSSWAEAASAPPTRPAAVKSPSVPEPSSRSSARTASASSSPSFPIRSTNASSLPPWPTRCATSASRVFPISAMKPTATVCASSSSSKRTRTRRWS